MALRGRLHEAVTDPVARRRTWESLLQGTWRSAVLAGDDAGAERELEPSARRCRLGEPRRAAACR